VAVHENVNATVAVIAFPSTIGVRSGRGVSEP